MSKNGIVLALVVLLALAIVPAFAGRPADEELTTARADVAVIPTAPSVDVRPSGLGAEHPAQDFRDSAALVLVGGMLIGLAAAVRRTV